MSERDRTALYRFYAGDDLLYVGVTSHLPRRIRQHDGDKPWALWITDVLVEYATTRAEALEREADAIRYERPRHNTLRADRPIPLPDPQVAAQVQAYVLGERLWNAAIALALAHGELTEPAIDDLKGRLDACFAGWVEDVLGIPGDQPRRDWIER